MKRYFKEHGMEILVFIVIVLTIFISIFSQENGSMIWTLLGNVDTIVGFITAIIAYLTWRTTRILRGKFEKETERIQSKNAINSVAISISCGNDIFGDVKSYLAEDASKTAYIELVNEKNKLDNSELFEKKYANTNSYVKSIDIFAHCISLNLNTMPEDEGQVGEFMRDYSTALEDICGLCKYNNISDIYLFIGAPMPIAFLAGEKFANKFFVYTHHHPSMPKDKSTSKKYVMTTCNSFRSYVDNNKLFEFS